MSIIHLYNYYKKITDHKTTIQYSSNIKFQNIKYILALCSIHVFLYKVIFFIEYNKSNNSFTTYNIRVG